jgi:hypothetical protein
MNKQRTVTRVVVLAATAWLAACTSASMSPPAGTSGSAGQSGSGPSGASPSGAGKSGSGQTGSAPASAGQSGASQSGAGPSGADPSGSSTAGAGQGEDPAAVFDKSLGDFDGEIGRERDAMAKAGQGSGRAAETQQSSDTSSVKTAGRSSSEGPDVSVSGPGMGAGFPGGMGGIGGIGASGGIGGEAGGRPASTKAGAGSSGAGAKTGDDPGVGPDGEPGTPDDTGSGTTATSGGVNGSGGSGAAVETLPADIPRNGAGEDQVARQLREAAIAEQDPAIRDALWNEYRKVMGMKTK